MGASTPIGYVAVYNRRDRYAYLLLEIQVWVSTTAGDITSAQATLCGSAQYDASHEPQPYVLYCDGATGGYVTVKQTTHSGYLSVAELQPYILSPEATRLVADMAHIFELAVSKSRRNDRLPAEGALLPGL